MCHIALQIRINLSPTLLEGSTKDLAPRSRLQSYQPFAALDNLRPRQITLQLYVVITLGEPLLKMQIHEPPNPLQDINYMRPLPSSMQFPRIRHKLTRHPITQAAPMNCHCLAQRDPLILLPMQDQYRHLYVVHIP